MICLDPSSLWFVIAALILVAMVSTMLGYQVGHRAAARKALDAFDRFFPELDS